MTRADKTRRNFIFIAIAFTYVISYFHRAAPAVVGPIIAGELGLSPAELGAIGSAYFWAYALAALPSGLLADTWGARRTIAAFVLVAAVGGVVFALSGGVVSLVASRFLIGLGVGVVYVAAMRIFSDWYAPDELATLAGVLLAVGNVGAILSTSPLVTMIGAAGWRPTFLAVAVSTAVAAVACFLIVRNRPSEAAATPAPASAPAGSGAFVVAIRRVFGEPRLYVLGFLLFSFYGTFMGVGSLWAGPWLQAVHHLDKAGAGGVLLFFPVGMAIGCPLAGWLSDKVFRSRKTVLVGGGLLHLLAYVPLVAFGADLADWSLKPLFFWYGLSGSAFVVCFAAVKELFPGHLAGAAVGALNIFLFTGGAFYQSAMGAVISQLAGLDPATLYARIFLLPMTGLALGLFAHALFFREDAAAGFATPLRSTRLADDTSGNGSN
jgi:sugar phosphate permease